MENKFTSRQYMVKNDFELFHTREELPPNVEYHNHDFYEIFFYMSGRVTYIIEGKSYRLKPGDIILINNKELHRTIIESGEDYERMQTLIVNCLSKIFLPNSTSVSTTY